MTEPDLALRITTAEESIHELSDLLYRLAKASASYVDTTASFPVSGIAKEERALMRSLLSETQGVLLRRGSA